MSAGLETVGTVRLETERFGSGPSLLYLHGEDGLIFSRPFLDRLATHHAVIAAHHPSWGRSTRERHINTVRDIALVYAELIEEADGPVHVVGASLGGWIAATLGVLRPRNLASLVLIAPTGVRFGGPLERNFVDLYVQDFDALPAVLYADATRAPSLSTCTDDEFVYLAESQEAMTRFCWSPYMHDPDLGSWLRRIEVPTCVISGSADHFVLAPDYFARYAQLIGDAGCRHIVLDGVGHRVEEEAPDALATVVASFLSDPQPSPTIVQER